MGTIEIDGSTPKLTIGNATAEDATILFDGNAQDFYIALDDSADDLLIGLGSTVGTTPAISIDENLAIKTYGDITMTGTTPTLTIGDAGAEDTAIVFDGNAQDYYVGLDDSADTLVLGLGSTLGTTPAITINSSQVATFAQAPVFPDGSIAVADLDIDGATDVGAAIVDADLFIMDDGAGGTNRKVTASRIKTYTGGGKIKQVVGSAYTTANANSGTSYADSGATLDITPTTNTNKILVHFSIPISLYRSSGSSCRYGYKVLRESTVIATGAATTSDYGMLGSSAEMVFGTVFNYTVYDEPDSTSEQTYKVQFANNETGSLTAQSGSNSTNITALEVEST